MNVILWINALENEWVWISFYHISSELSPWGLINLFFFSLRLTKLDGDWNVFLLSTTSAGENPNKQRTRLNYGAAF